MSAVVVPTPPAPFVSLDRHSAFLDDILKLEAELSARHEERTAAFASARAVQNAASLALHRRHAGDAAGAAAKLSEAADGLALLLPHRGESEEDAGLSAAIQQVCVAHVFDCFLTTGTLGARPAGAWAWPNPSSRPALSLTRALPLALTLNPAAACVPEAPPPPRAAGAKSGTRAAGAGEAGEAGEAPPAYTDEEWLGATRPSPNPNPNPSPNTDRGPNPNPKPNPNQARLSRALTRSGLTPRVLVC